jgi:hypothetical protein
MTKPDQDWEGYAVPAGSYTAKRVRGPGYLATLGIWVIMLMLAMMALSVIVTHVSFAPEKYVCPPDCGRPPSGLPVATNPRFTAANGDFSVSYPANEAAYTVVTDANGVTAKWNAGDGGTLRLFSEPARGREAKEITEALIADSYPDAQTSYELPNAMVGFHPGYGVVSDEWSPSAHGGSDHQRLIMIVAVKNDLALVAAAIGPFHQFGPDFGPGPPSPANLAIAEDMGKYVNSFSWRGDPPR